MNAVVPTLKSSEIVYPSGDGKPIAESYDHLYAILTTLEVIKQYPIGQRTTVLANQYLYEAEGFPKLRTAPDVMVIYDVEPGGRDNDKICLEGQVPKVIFEITSPSTQNAKLDSRSIFKLKLKSTEINQARQLYNFSGSSIFRIESKN